MPLSQSRPSTNQTLPSGPAVMSWSCDLARQRGSSVTTPFGVVRARRSIQVPFLSRTDWMNHRLPSGPAVSSDAAWCRGVGKTRTAPRGVIRPIVLNVIRALSAASVRNVVAPVRALFATAVEEGLIRHNPAGGLRLPGRVAGPEDRVKALSDDELAALLAAADEGAPRLLLRFLADTGLRIGEAIALTWADVDIEARRLHVRRRLYRGRIDAPKSRFGLRAVPLTTALAADLDLARRLSMYPDDEDPVFATLAGTRHQPSNLLRRVLKPAAKRAGLLGAEGKPWPGFHTLRHTCANRLFRAGLDAKRVQVILGHHDPGFTLRTYVHLVPSDLPDLDLVLAEPRRDPHA